MTLDVTRVDGVVTVTLNRPKTKNALNEAMYLDLLSVTGEIAGEPRVTASSCSLGLAARSAPAQT